jgi:hypothetical protein
LAASRASASGCGSRVFFGGRRYTCVCMDEMIFVVSGKPLPQVWYAPAPSA